MSPSRFAVLALSLFVVACSAPVKEKEAPARDTIKESAAQVSSKPEETVELEEAESVIYASGKPWVLSVFLQDEVATRALLPLKNNCEGNMLTWRYMKAFPYDLSEVILNPGEKELESSAPFKTILDAVFSEDCSTVYALGAMIPKNPEALGMGQVDIYAYDIASAKWTAVSKKLSPEWVDLETARPLPTMIYPIDAGHLFVYAQQATTGGDAYTDQTSKGIYDLQAAKIEWVERGGGLPPAIYNTETKTLSVFAALPQEDLFRLTRTDISLLTKEKVRVSLLKRMDMDSLFQNFYANGLPCYRVNFTNPESYAGCMDGFWRRAFP